MKTKLKIKLIIVLFLLILTVIPITYSRYISRTSGELATQFGTLIANIETDSKDTYKEDNKAYFIVNVKNFKNVAGVEKLTDTDVDYTVTIKNNNNTIGKYTWKKIGGTEQSDTPASIKVITGTLPKTKKTDSYKVYVTGNSSSAQTIQYNVSLYAKQANKG